MSPEHLQAYLVNVQPKPFSGEVVQSPWSNVIHVPSLHAATKEMIQSRVLNCSTAESVRCLTLKAPSGYGKTHLMAWTRQWLEESDQAMFLYIPPYSAENQDRDSLDQHILRAAIEARLRSVKQKTWFEQQIRKLLVETYDDIIQHRKRDIKNLLRAGTFWSRLFRPSGLKIGKLEIQQQLTALQHAFERPYFLEEAFQVFRRTHSPCPPDVQLDQDAFIAACYLACGTVEQRWKADNWFLAPKNMPLQVFNSIHIRHACSTGPKILNSLYTLHRMLDRRFCMVFDQLEDTFTPLAGDESSGLWLRYQDSLMLFVRRMTAMPGFCTIFCCQPSDWEWFARRTNKMVLDRMAEGGVQELTAMNNTIARELVQVRMNALVWKNAEISPDDQDRYFPFTEEEIDNARKDVGGEIRPFIARMRDLLQQ